MRLVLALFLAASANAVTLQPFMSGLQRPVQVVFHQSRPYVALQDGRVLRADGSLLYDLRPVVLCCANGSGLLSIVFHPTNGDFFAQYVDLNGNTAIARYRGDAGEVLLTVEQPKDEVPNHHGGTLVFGPDGYLYFCIGDGGADITVTTRAQDPTLLLGKLLRMDANSGHVEFWSVGVQAHWRAKDETTAVGASGGQTILSVLVLRSPENMDRQDCLSSRFPNGF